MTVMQTSPHLGSAAGNLRTLLQSGPSRDAVARLLSQPASAHVFVERMHFPAGNPAHIQIRVQCPDGQSRMLLGEWIGECAVATAQTEAARLTKKRRGKSSSSASVVADPHHGLVLRKPGFDAKLPGLRLLHDPGWAAERLSLLGLDPTSTIALVAHRLGKRAVLMIRGEDGTRFARLRPVTSLSGRDAYVRHKALWATLQGSADLSIPRPLGFDSEIGLALFASLSGAPPVFQGLAGFAAVASVMRAMTRLQSLRPPIPVHGAADEMALLDGWARRVREVFPDLARHLVSPLDQLRAQMSSLQERPAVLCHGDLHEGQILLQDGTAGLLDFDTLRMGDPALDVGNLQAHLILASLREDVSRRAFVTALDNALTHVPLSRIALWRRAALLRLAMIYAFSSEPRDVIHALIEHASRGSAV